MFVRRKFFKICVLSQCIVYQINFENIDTFTIKKTLLHRLSLLVFKILQCILNFCGNQKATMVSSILTISKYNWNLALKRVTTYISTKACFIYFAPSESLKKVRRISNWSEILCQINQEILKRSDNNQNNWKTPQLMWLQLTRIC